jgi:hypothetical protein
VYLAKLVRLAVFKYDRTQLSKSANE